MARLSLVFALGALAVFAGLRSYRARVGSGATAGEGGLAVERGARGYLRRQWLVVAAWALGLIGVLAAVYGALRPLEAFDPFSTRARVAVVAVVGFALGLLGPATAAHLATSSPERSVGDGGGDGVDGVDGVDGDVAASALRNGAGVALVGLGVAVLAFAGALGLAWRLAADGVDHAVSLPLAVGAHALGAVVAAAVVHFGGGLFVAGALPAARDAIVDEPDARNPAVVVARVAVCVDRGTLAASGVELATLDVVAATTLAAGLCAANTPWLARVDLGALGVILAPLVIRGFALLAAWVGAMAVKSGHGEPPGDALARGHLVACGLTALGTLAATHWLLRGAFLGFGGASVLGILAGWALVRFGGEAHRIGSGDGDGPGRSGGAFAATVPTLAVVIVGLAAYALGNATGLSHGGVFGVALATLGLLGSSPLVLAAALGEPERSATTSASAGDAWRRLTLVGAVLVAWCLLRAFFYATLVQRAATTLVHAVPDVDLGRPAVLVSCALGAVLAIGAAMLTLRAAPHVGGELRAEVARVLAEVPHGPDGARVFPIDFHAPADRSVDNVAADAHLHAAATLLALLGVPIVVGVTMRRLAELGAECVAALGLGAMLVTLVLPPLGRAMGIDATGGAARPVTTWMAVAARVVTAVALALPSVFA